MTPLNEHPDPRAETASSALSGEPTSSGPEDLGFALPPPARTSRVAVIAAMIAVVGGGLALGWARRSKAHPAAAADSSRLPRVELIAPAVVEGDRAMTLPGTVRALEQTRIFPRVTGYVRRWLVDLGDKVAAGQLLVEIDSPELDAQLSGARAQLAQAQAAVKQVAAQRDFAKANSARYATLADQQLVSRARVEETQAQASTDEASVTAAESNVAAQQANVRRLMELQGFTRVVAPFAGTVTTRSIERGDLVAEGKGAELYTIAAVDPVRVFVEVPQSVAASVQVGGEATIAVRELAGRKFAGKVTRAARALDPELRTMTTEIQVANPDGALMPGMYVQATLAFPVPRRVVEIPATALYSDARGLRVGVVDAQHRLRMVPITIERDTGATLQIATGLTGDERVVKIALPGLAEGDAVEVAAPDTARK